MTSKQVPLQLNNSLRYVFVDFIANETAVEALRNFQKLPQFTYLWGDVSSGKTHLLGALEHELRTAQLSNLMLDADMISDKDVFNNIPDNLAFLLLDDVDKLKSDSTFELDLFNMYNLCRSQGTKLLVSSAVSPRSTDWQLPDLKSRLNSGLLLTLESLKGELALECIKRQFFNYGIPLDLTVINYLKTTQNTSYQYLYKLFLYLASESLKLKRKVTIPLVKKAIQDIEISNE